MKILVIEDEARLAMVLEELLCYEGFDVSVRYDGESGLDEALTNTYDMIVLDIMLPKKNGIDVLVELRKQKISSYILMLTAKSELKDKVKGLRAGADDYLTKPFETEEFIARIWALARRNDRGEYINQNLQFGDITLDRSYHTIVKNEDIIKLSVKEFQLLEFLIINQNHVMSKEQCVEKIWGLDTDTEYNSIEVYVSFLRKKLSALVSSVSIQTIRGVGYQISIKE